MVHATTSFVLESTVRPQKASPMTPSSTSLLWLMIAICLTTASQTCLADDDFSARQIEFFERRVRPVLVEKCVSCHGEKKQESSLRLDTRSGMLDGGDRGSAIDLETIDSSWIMQALEHRDDLTMPSSGDKLSANVIADFRTWVADGAAWPASVRLIASLARQSKDHWAFQPLVDPQPPPHDRQAADWIRSPLDVFVWRKLREAKLAPSSPADRRTLARRLNFDLLGLPPTERVIREFESDTAPDAYERFVDRLLSSPAFGERWGRYWLDLARYADNKGYVFFEDKKFPWAYAYRDYVVEALNADKPYDEFIREQIAADQLDLTDRSALRAMGFLTVGAHFMNNTHDIIDDRIDVVMRGVMGLTVTCARCHDHKTDPISQADYYSLYGVFRSSREPLLPPLFSQPRDSEAYQNFKAGMQQRLGKLHEFVDRQHEQLVTGAKTRAAEYLIAAHQVRNHPPTDDFMLLTDKGALNPTMIRRWRIYLEDPKKSSPRVWAAWRAVADLSEAAFAAQAPKAIERILKAGMLNPLVAESIGTCKLTSRRNLADCYAELLQQMERKHQATAEAAGAAGIQDEDERELVMAFRGPAAPPNLPKVMGWGFLSLLPDRPTQGEFKKLLKEVETWSVSKSAPPRAMVLVDAKPLYEPRVFVRGNPNRLGQPTRRRYLEFFNAKKTAFQDGSGRRELADAIVDVNNPLTARVAANRVWSRFFGSGLVSRTNDFGLQSDPPSHPAMLDLLARRLQRDNWSIKGLIRSIVVSATYRQQSLERRDAMAVDPNNRWLWRMKARRLDFESMRDSMLAAADQLDRRIGGPSVALLKRDAFVARRTIYGFVDRMDVDPLLTAFDYPNPVSASGQRVQTTTTAQSLFFMNSHFVRQVALRVEQRDDLRNLDPTEKIRRLFQVLFGREPSAAELQIAVGFQEPLDQDGGGKSEGSKLVWIRFIQGLLMSNEFVFID